MSTNIWVDDWLVPKSVSRAAWSIKPSNINEIIPFSKMLFLTYFEESAVSKRTGWRSRWQFTRGELGLNYFELPSRNHANTNREVLGFEIILRNPKFEFARFQLVQVLQSDKVVRKCLEKRSVTILPSRNTPKWNFEIWIFYDSAFSLLVHSSDLRFPRICRASNSAKSK